MNTLYKDGGSPKFLTLKEWNIIKNDDGRGVLAWCLRLRLSLAEKGIPVKIKGYDTPPEPPSEYRKLKVIFPLRSPEREG